MASTGETRTVIARYHPVGKVLAPALLVIVFGVFMAWPYFYTGGLNGFLDENRNGFSYWISSLGLGPIGIGMGLLLGYRMIAERGVAVRFDGEVFHFTQPLMVRIKGEDIRAVEPSSDGFRNFALQLSNGEAKQIYGSFYDRSSYEIAREIHALLDLPPPAKPEEPPSLEDRPQRPRRKLS